MKEIKNAVQVVILNDDGEVLAVSRKDNHEDFGLVGGKVDDEDYQHGLYKPLIAGIIRETKEETGLTIYEGGLIPVFSMHRDGYMGHTYLATKWSGEIHTDEPHVVKWVPFETVINGSFGHWNTMVADSLTSMGIKFKILDSPFDDVYYFHIHKNDGRTFVSITPKTFWDEEECLPYDYSDTDRHNIHKLADNYGFRLLESMESQYEVMVDNKLITNIYEILNLMLSAGFRENKDFSKFLKQFQ
jgi:8-oxo-dGTP pyrophosphatase MutT (NUDIX family)